MAKPVFKLYDCKIRIGGSVANEVRRYGVTAPEVEMFRAVHGSDAISEITESGQVSRTDREERARIEGIFANPNKTFGAALTKKQAAITHLFGHERNPLPKELELDAAAEPDEDAEDEAEAEQPEAPVAETAPRPPVRRKVVAPPAFTE